VRIFDGFLDVEGADRLPPFKSETPKSRKNSRFWAGSDYTRHLRVRIIFIILIISIIMGLCKGFFIKNNIKKKGVE